MTRSYRSNSLYYGSIPSINAFPTYATADLLRDLESPSLDNATCARIEAEIARRSAKRAARHTTR
jgi:hypothetical protein